MRYRGGIHLITTLLGQQFHLELCFGAFSKNGCQSAYKMPLIGVNLNPSYRSAIDRDFTDSSSSRRVSRLV